MPCQEDENQRTDALPFTKFIMLDSIINGSSGLYLHLALKDRFHARNIPFERIELIDRGQMFAALDEIAVDIRRSHSNPILHLENHGTISGLQMGNGEIISHEEFYESLVKINSLMGNKLLIVVAACFGWYMNYVISPIKASPCWGILGPHGPVDGGDDLYPGYLKFYEELLIDGDLNNAIRALRAEVPRGSDFYLTPSKELFIMAFKNYINKFCAGDELEDRIDRLVELAKADGRNDLIDYIRVEARRMICDKVMQREYFERFKRIFFMYDTFPNNISKFNVSFDALNE